MNRCSTCPVPHSMSEPRTTAAAPVAPPPPLTPRSPLSLAPLQLACCGTPELCGSSGGQCSGETLTDMEPPEGDIVVDAETGETMRCDEAWRALKAHPNVTHASLSLLADVVARRTKCTGPRVELSPEPFQGAREADAIASTQAVSPKCDSADGRHRILRRCHRKRRRVLTVSNAGCKLKHLPFATRWHCSTPARARAQGRTQLGCLSRNVATNEVTARYAIDFCSRYRKWSLNHPSA